MIQILIIALFTIAFVSLPMQLALIKRKYVTYLWLIAVAIFTYFMHTKAIEQSYSLFREQLANPDLIGNLLVIQITEAFAGVLLSIFLLRLYHKERVKKAFRFFKYFPGVMPFISLFYLESYLFLNVRGMGFHSLALIIAVGFMIAVWGCMILFRWLLSDYDIMLEMKFFLHIIQMIAALIISVHLFGLQVPKQTEYLSFQQTGIILGAAVMVIAVGLIYYQLKIKKIIKK